MRKIITTSATALARAAALALSVLGSVVAAQAVNNYSPSDVDWDCAISGGGQKGLAVIRFSEDGTFIGYQILTANPKSATWTDPTYGRTPVVAGRGAVETGRGTSGSSVTPTAATGGATSTLVVPRTNLFGFAQISGPWRYDLKGRVVGFYSLQVASADAEEGVAETHGIGFTAKVSPGKRLTLLASTPGGSVTYSGAPVKDMPDLTGSWYATKVKNKQKLQEFFSLNSFAIDNPWIEAFPELATFSNMYFTSDGQGAGYSFMGAAIFSVRKQMALVFQTLPSGATNGVLSTTLGSVAVKRTYVKVSSTGVEEPYSPISYTAVLTAE